MYFKSIFAALLISLPCFMFAGEAAAVTVTYGGSTSSAVYTESGVRHNNYYNSFGNNGHWHDGGDYIYGHASCCSNLGRITLTNGNNFGVTSLTRRNGGSAVWTAYNSGGSSIGSVTISGSSGTYNFPSSWAGGLSRIDISFNNGNFGWDNLVVNECLVTADAGSGYTVAEGGSVGVSAGGSTATGGSISSYGWDFTSGSGTGPFNDATGSSATFSAASLGGPATATIGVQATCSGVNDDDQTTVTITNVAPSLTASIPSTGVEGTAVTFGVTVSDPGPDTHTYLWNFGDGNTSTQQNPTHTYADDSSGQGGGEYTVTVTVDDGADTTTSTGGINVANVAPQVANAVAMVY